MASAWQKAKERGQILDEIMRYHREQLPKIKRETPLADLRALTMVVEPALDFVAALAQPGVSLIAECKKASPSKGLIAKRYDPVDLAETYVRGGARAISVLTDGRHFQGSLTDMQAVKETVTSRLHRLTADDDPRRAIGIPVLRKDFVFDPYQVLEARAAGADAILLIAAVLEPAQLGALLAQAHDLGMNALVEVHTDAELEAVLPLKPRIIGVNNRNLQTFKVDFENTARLRAMIPDDVVVVGESGLKSAADMHTMGRIGVDAVLVGESLVRSQERLGAVRALVRAGSAA